MISDIGPASARHDLAFLPFLHLLAADLVTRLGETIRSLPPALANRLTALAENIGDVDFETSIEGHVSL
jgi:hypothetical protein